MENEQQPFEVLTSTAGKAMESGSRAARSVKRSVTSMFKKLFICLFLILLGFAGGVFMVKDGTLPFLSPKEDEPIASPEPVEIVADETTITAQDVEMALEPASELVTSVYRYKNAASVQAVKKLVDFDLPGTLSRAVFTYSGTVKMGFDLSDIAIEVDDATKTITITLPPFDIISSEIDMDSFEFVLEDQSLFNPIDPSEYTGALSKLKQEANTQARNDEDFMRQAKLNAQTVLESFLRSAGIEEDYTIEFKFRGDN